MLALAARYRIRGVVGRGGGGVVHDADDLDRGHRVALKLVPTSDAAATEALLCEFARLRGVRHPGLVEVFDFGVAAHEGAAVSFLAMERVDGPDLEELARTAPAEALLSAIVDVAHALAATHRLGLVHGDVKPSNVVVAASGRAKLIDFGASELRWAALPPETLSGTPAFMAPELLAGARPDVRTDVFAFGRTLAVLADAAPLAPELRPLIKRLTRTSRASRPASMEEVLEALGPLVPARADERPSLPYVFAGRARELAEIERACATFGARGPRLIWIQGARGAGKTRALAEAKWRVALRAAVREPFASRSGAPGLLGATLVDAITGLDRGAPRALVVDDADRGAPLFATVERLARVLTPSSRLAIVAASTEAPPSTEDGVLLHVPLGPLDADDVAPLLEGRVAIVTAGELVSATAGAPAAITALLRALESGAVSEVELRAVARDAAAPSLPRAKADAITAALARLRRAPRADRAAVDAARIDVVDALLRSGATRDAARALRPLRARTHDLGARALDVMSRALLRAGAFDESLRVAELGLARAVDDVTRAELRGTTGVALAYLSRDAEARAALAEAITLARGAGLALAEARARIQLGIVDYRAGEASAAAAGFDAAIAMAEPLDALDLVANASLNLGIARHQLGDLALALAAYERGELVARALGSAPLTVAIGANLAKLHVDLGLFDRALAASTRARARASEAGLDAFVPFADSIRADALALLGRSEEAASVLDAARAAYVAMGATREVAEVTLERVRLHVEALEPARAEALLGDVRAAARGLDAADLHARLALEEARLERSKGNVAAELAQLERAVDQAQRAKQRLLEADARASLAAAYGARGASLLEERERVATRAILERTLATLPPEIAESFAAHPARLSARAHGEARPTSAAPSSGREARLERLVAIARRLSSTLDPKAVLDMAVDAAIDFTGAERGFVILRDEGLTLLSPRNMGQRPLEEDVAFSRGIAERVLRTGEPIVTMDAQRDERFEMQRSIHAMRLSSVMGVPVRGPDGVVAALYLDHRARRGAFDSAELDLVLALADHVAIALSSARLHAALEERTRELELERARTMELLREKSEEADRLALEVRAREADAAERLRGSRIIGKSPPMLALFEKIARVSTAPVSVLVTGESGTGKELVARAIHAESPRRARPFVAINCGAIPETLLESELFGYRAGAFTGATRDREGLFLAADGGTLFLDEIGEMPAALQVKLLRVLQGREVQALGAPAPVPIDVRLVTATHRDLRSEIASGRFREDLYYRVAVVEVTVPALRDRLDDLPWLAPALLERAAGELGREPPGIARDAMRAMLRHDWPGNVRELENALTKAMVLADRDVVRAADLGLEKAAPRARPAALTRATHDADEDRRIDAALRAAGFNVAEACRALGMPRATMYRRLKRRGASPPLAAKS